MPRPTGPPSPPSYRCESEVRPPPPALAASLVPPAAFLVGGDCLHTSSHGKLTLWRSSLLHGHGVRSPAAPPPAPSPDGGSGSPGFAHGHRGSGPSLCLVATCQGFWNFRWDPHLCLVNPFSRVRTASSYSPPGVFGGSHITAKRSGSKAAGPFPCDKWATPSRGQEVPPVHPIHRRVLSGKHSGWASTGGCLTPICSSGGRQRPGSPWGSGRRPLSPLQALLAPHRWLLPTADDRRMLARCHRLLAERFRLPRAVTLAAGPPQLTQARLALCWPGCGKSCT